MNVQAKWKCTSEMKKDKNFELKSFYITKTTKPPFGSFFFDRETTTTTTTTTTMALIRPWRGQGDGLLLLLPLLLGAAEATPASTPIDAGSEPPPPTPAWRRPNPKAGAATGGLVPYRELMEKNKKARVRWYRNEYSSFLIKICGFWRFTNWWNTVRRSRLD